MPGRYRSFWAAVPSAMMVGPACSNPTKLTPTYGAPARSHSSLKISCSTGEEPCPPPSAGQSTPA